MTEEDSGTFVHTRLIRLCLDLNLWTHDEHFTTVDETNCTWELRNTFIPVFTIWAHKVSVRDHADDITVGTSCHVIYWIRHVSEKISWHTRFPRHRRGFADRDLAFPGQKCVHCCAGPSFRVLSARKDPLVTNSFVWRHFCPGFLNIDWTRWLSYTQSPVFLCHLVAVVATSSSPHSRDPLAGSCKSENKRGPSVPV